MGISWCSVTNYHLSSENLTCCWVYRSPIFFNKNSRSDFLIFPEPVSSKIENACSRVSRGSVEFIFCPNNVKNIVKLIAPKIPLFYCALRWVFKIITTISQILFTSLAPSPHWEFRMSMLKLNVKRAPKMLTIFWIRWLSKMSSLIGESHSFHSIILKRHLMLVWGPLEFYLVLLQSFH